MRIASRWIVVLALGPVLPGCTADPRLDQTFVTGGDEISLAQAPWTASLNFRSVRDGQPVAYHLCGAANLGGGWVATAAHCVGWDSSTFTVVLDRDTYDGVDDSGGYLTPYFENLDDAIDVAEVIPHPDFFMDGSVPVNDLALLRLVHAPDPDDAVRPLAQDTALAEGVVGRIEGWGYDEHDRRGAALKEATMSVLPPAQGTLAYGARFRPDAMVVAQPGTGATCGGDSGGPFVVDVDGSPRLAGLVSAGATPCGQHPSVFTRVAAYSDWIASTTGMP